jgi:hypothetical protein
LQAAYDAAVSLAGETINARNAEVGEQAERIRQLERELAERKTASIGDSVDFQALLSDVMVASKTGQSVTAVAEKVQALIAYIDERK